MWMLKWLGIAVLLIILLGIAMLNVGQEVDVDLLIWQFQDLPLILVIFEAFIAGMLVWFLIAFFNELRLRNELRALRRGNEELGMELRAHRNQPLEEPEVTEEADPSRSVDEHVV